MIRPLLAQRAVDLHRFLEFKSPLRGVIELFPGHSSQNASDLDFGLFGRRGGVNQFPAKILH
jgi:hypothetical protein